MSATKAAGANEDWGPMPRGITPLLVRRGLVSSDKPWDFGTRQAQDLPPRTSIDPIPHLQVSSEARHLAIVGFVASEASVGFW